MNALLPGVRHEGAIRLDDTDVYSREMDPVALRRRVGMVFQRWNPFPKSIYDNVAYGPRVNGIRKRADLDAIVESALQRAALWDEVKDRLRESALGLSGGQQQRLCIARALANEPEVLLLDEPASALDPIATQKVEELLYELKRELTIIIVTHNLQQAARVSDTTAFFYLGRARRNRADRSDVHEPGQRTHRGLHHREIRMTPVRCSRTIGFRHFHDQLAHLKQRLLDMSDLATSLLDLSVDALLEPRRDDGRGGDRPATASSTRSSSRSRTRRSRCSRCSSRWRATFASSSRRSRSRTISSASAITR